MANYTKTLQKVKSHLKPGETIEFSVFGAYEKNGFVKNGIFAATNERMIFFGLKIFGFDFESFAYNKITSVEVTKQIMGHVITIHSAGGNMLMKWINKGDVFGFVDFVNSKN